MENKFKPICVAHDATIIHALKQMDAVKHKLLIVVRDDKFYRLLSIGDIQRAIIKGMDMNSPVTTILRDKTKVASVNEDMRAVKATMKERSNEFMPIVDDENNLVDVIFWEDLFETKERIPPANLNLPVVIMAGGKGTRLRPLTNVLPKPLVPIGEQTMMEDIMDRFVQCGCNNFFVSVNFKADFIRHYFDNFAAKKYNIEYFQEDKPLGTAGSLHLLKGKKSIYIPYGTLETGEEGLLNSIQEKPELTFKINTGMYILEPHLLKEIPSDRVYHITYLIDKLVKEGRRVGVFPVNEGSWTDVGNWDEYLKQFVK